MSDDRLAIREVFYGVQGEGLRAGQPTVFVRFAGCNLNCSFCDTDWQYGDKLKFCDLATLMKQLTGEAKPKWVCLTGGEPCAAPAFDALVGALLEAEYSVSVETNGTIWKESLHECHVVVSPKARWEGVRGLVSPDMRHLNAYSNAWERELKVLVSAETTFAEIEAERKAMPFLPTALLLQPIYESRRAWENAYKLVLRYPNWRLSLQLHKWIGAR